MLRVFRDHSPSLVSLALFLAFLLGQSVAGHIEFNENRRDHGDPGVSYGAYLATGHFLEATTENWESEFLQMGAFVVLTAILFQKGSAESRDRRSRMAGVPSRR